MPSPEEYAEFFAAMERAMSRPEPTPSPRRLRSLLRSAGKPAAGGPSRRQRCDARVKNLLKIGKNGVRVSRRPFCKAWAMENGRCWMHGGASTGPKSPDGKARVVAAMVEGRCKWIARRRVEGGKFPAGRKRGERWVTEPMRERARAEARRLGAGRFMLDHALTLALLRSANGDPAARAKAKAMLDAQESAAIQRDRERALAIVIDLRAKASWPDAFQSVKIDSSAYAAPVEARADSDPTAAPVKFRRNLVLALERLWEILSQPIGEGTGVRERRIVAKAAEATIKAMIATDKNVLKAERGGFR